jgi:hypothetical protein
VMKDLATARGGLSGMVAGPTTLFWSGPDTNVYINDAPLDGGATKVLARPQAQFIPDIFLATDGTLYWSTGTQIQSIVP